MKLEGNTILITGGANGIGFELSKELQKRGNTVIVTGRSQEKLERAKRQIPELHIVQSDVSRISDIESLFTKVTHEFPALNVLINNAGVMRSINLHKEEGSLEDLTSEIDTNLKGPIRMVRKFLPQLKKMDSAAFVPLPIAPIYCATKAAIHSFSLSLRAQLKNTKVKVFEIAPPATQTDLLGEFDSEDMSGASIMKVDDMVRASLKGLENDQFEIRPGQSNQLRFMSRLAPAFILAQMSKPVDRMLAK